MYEVPSQKEIDITLQNAKEGDVSAQTNLAWWYLQGLGLEQDSKEAFYWYMQAANAGNGHAQHMLAKRYTWGEGTEQNFEQAFFWYQKAYESEPLEPTNAYELGRMYFEGLGTHKDLEKAASFFREAAKIGSYELSIYYYGLCLFKGYGIDQDKEEGLKLIKNAAKAEVKEALDFLEELSKAPFTYEEAMEELENLIGINEVKDEIKRLMHRIELYNLRKQHKLPSKKPDLHLVFKGNPGTGKTTVARILGAIFKGIGLLETGHVVEVSKAELVSSYIGQTPSQVKDQVIKALGGVLFIDEAYTLVDVNEDGHVQGHGGEAVATLLKLMEDHRDNLVVIAAGYEKEMNNFLKSNPGLSSRFTNIIGFNDYSAQELFQVFKLFCSKEQYHLTEGAEKKLKNLIEDILSTKLDHFGNARVIRNLFRETIINLSGRLAKFENKTKEQLEQIEEDDIPSRENLNDLFKGRYKRLPYEKAMAEIDKMIGLKQVKKEMTNFINRIKFKKLRENQGLNDEGFNVHMIFQGSPGTGKTTVARLLGDILRGIGVLKTGHVVEVSQSDLIGEFIGHTAPKVRRKVQEALGGILFIDEAYALMNQSGSSADFGADAVNTLMKLMEDHRGELVVIMAGYKEEMDEFLKSNPGFLSRFTNSIEFEDYKEEELIEIYLSFCDKEGYQVNEQARDNLRALLKKVTKDTFSKDKKHFGHGRFMRLIFRGTQIKMANRLSQLESPSKEDLQKILGEDIPEFEELKFLDDKRKIGF